MARDQSRRSRLRVLEVREARFCRGSLVGSRVRVSRRNGRAEEGDAVPHAHSRRTEAADADEEELQVCRCRIRRGNGSRYFRPHRALRRRRRGRRRYRRRHRRLPPRKFRRRRKASLRVRRGLQPCGRERRGELEGDGQREAASRPRARTTLEDRLLRPEGLGWNVSLPYAARCVPRHRRRAEDGRQGLGRGDGRGLRRRTRGRVRVRRVEERDAVYPGQPGRLSPRRAEVRVCRLLVRFVPRREVRGWRRRAQVREREARRLVARLRRKSPIRDSRREERQVGQEGNGEVRLQREREGVEEGVVRRVQRLGARLLGRARARPLLHTDSRRWPLSCVLH